MEVSEINNVKYCPFGTNRPCTDNCPLSSYSGCAISDLVGEVELTHGEICGVSLELRELKSEFQELNATLKEIKKSACFL